MFDATAALDSLEVNMSRSLYRCRYDREHRNATIPVLLKLLAVEDLPVKQRAMRAVATIGRCNAMGALAPVVPLLSADVKHEDELTRQTAIGALHAVGGDHPAAAVPALIRACDDERLLAGALLALVKIGKSGQSVATCFRRFATHRNGKIRRLVMRGLDAIRADDEASRAILQAALYDPNKRVREMAERVIARMDAGS